MQSRSQIINKNKFTLQYLRDLCHESPILIISTNCGIGKYTFNKIIYDESNNLIFEYKLILDESFSDTRYIKYKLGEYFRLTAEQLIYTFKYYASS